MSSRITRKMRVPVNARMTGPKKAAVMRRGHRPRSTGEMEAAEMRLLSGAKRAKP